MNTKQQVMRELTPLSDGDCIYVIERRKKEFAFPIHTHKEYEINYVENAPGAQRVVGDSIEEIGQYDLVLIANENLEHAWQTHHCDTGNIREITIQFSGDWLAEGLLNKNQFLSIKKMLEKGKNGLAFSMATIIKIRPLLNALTIKDTGFYLVINFLSMLYELSIPTDSRTLASSSFSQAGNSIVSRRVRVIDNYLKENYSKDITLGEMSAMVNMSEVAFSRFFSLHAGKSFTDYLTDIRIGRVARLLVDSSKSIAEICYECGYKNISNFNRMFKKKKGCSPREFRDLYQKKQVII